MINSQLLKRLTTVFLHLSVWSLLLIFFYFDDEEITPLLNLLFFLVPYLGLFYFNSLFNIKRYLVTKQFTKYVVLLLVSIVVAISIESCLDYREHLNCCADKELYSWKYRTLDNAFFSLFVLGLSFSYSFLVIWRRNEKLKKESELKLLKSQMNPHFLFNSLNTLYSLVSDKQLEKAEDAILKLSNLLRYSVYQVDDSKVSIEEEINYIKNYIALQELRLAGRVDISFDCRVEKSNIFIEPMLLIPFVENAFKHGVSYTQESTINIELRVKEKELIFKELTFSVINTVNESPKKMDKFSGVGIANVVARLKLLYPGNHTLSIENENGLYSVSLIIKN